MAENLSKEEGDMKSDCGTGTNSGLCGKGDYSMPKPRVSNVRGSFFSVSMGLLIWGTIVFGLAGMPILGSHGDQAHAGPSSFIDSDELPPQLAEGESYYTGKGIFDGCESVTASFILSADKKKVHSVTILLSNLSVNTVNGNSHAKHTASSVKTTVREATPVDNGSAVVGLARNDKLVLRGLEGMAPRGTLTYSVNFPVSLTPGQAGSGDRVLVPLGVTEIVFSSEQY